MKTLDVSSLAAAASFLLLAFAVLAQANGGFIKLAENNHLISISLAPISPSVGEKQQALVSFVYNYSLIKEKINATVQIKKGEKTIFSENKVVGGGVMDLTLSYPEEGVYEVFVEFSKESEPQLAYKPEDFLVQVKNSAPGGRGFTFAEFAAASLIVFVLGWILGKKIP